MLHIFNSNLRTGVSNFGLAVFSLSELFADFSGISSCTQNKVQCPMHLNPVIVQKKLTVVAVSDQQFVHHHIKGHKDKLKSAHTDSRKMVKKSVAPKR